MSSSASMTSGAPAADVPAVELRASVLDAAISLGFRNSVMKRWMFDAVDEADDDESGEVSSSITILRLISYLPIVVSLHPSYLLCTRLSFSFPSHVERLAWLCCRLFLSTLNIDM